MHLPFGVLLGLVTFLVWNAIASVLVAGFARLLAGRAERAPAWARARLLFALRVLPATLSTAFVLGFFAPSYLLLEPEASGEHAGLRLTILALGTLLLWTLALWRSLGSWRSTTRLLRSWLSGAQPLAASGYAAFEIEEAFPVVSVVGSLRPRVFVARQVREALLPAELAVALAHEAAHVAARDNLKRLAFECAPDVLGLLPASRAMRREWERAAEASADVAAVRGDRTRALDLSSALVKVARLVPQGRRFAWPASALHDGEDIDYRVRLLLALDLAEEDRPGRGGAAAVALAACGAIALATLATQPAVMHAVQELTETLVRLLS